MARSVRRRWQGDVGLCVRGGSRAAPAARIAQQAGQGGDRRPSGVAKRGVFECGKARPRPPRAVFEGCGCRKRMRRASGCSYARGGRGPGEFSCGGRGREAMRGLVRLGDAGFGTRIPGREAMGWSTFSSPVAAPSRRVSCPKSHWGRHSVKQLVLFHLSPRPVGRGSCLDSARE